MFSLCLFLLCFNCLLNCLFPLIGQYTSDLSLTITLEEEYKQLFGPIRRFRERFLDHPLTSYVAESEARVPLLALYLPEVLSRGTWLMKRCTYENYGKLLM